MDMFGLLGPMLANLPAGGMRNYGARGRGRGGGRQPYFILLVVQLLHKISNLRRKPPLTLALMAGMSALHLKPELLEAVIGGGGAGGFASNWNLFSVDHVRRVCMMPATMFETFQRTGGLEFQRFFLSAFVHGDDMHLYYNMASFLLKGVSLELTMGSQAFAALLMFSTVASQALILLSSWLLLTVFGVSGPMQSCSVGFSGVLFALKYVLARRSPGVVSMFGFRVHTRYATWLELVLISCLVPNASFLGHLCGIFAGILYVELPIVLPILSIFSGFSLFAQAPSYTYGSGTTTASARSESSSSPGAGPWVGRDGGEGQGGGGGAAGQRPGAVPPLRDGDNYDGAASYGVSAEEAELQEALRRSRLDMGGGGGSGGGSGGGGDGRSGGGYGSGGGNGGGGGDGHGFGGESAGSGSSRRGGNDGAATVESRQETPSAPSAPPADGSGGGGQGDSGGGLSRQELRRRRVARHIDL